MDLPLNTRTHPEYNVWKNANVGAKKHYCKIWDYPTSTSTKLHIHLTWQKHKIGAAAAAGLSLGSDLA